MLTLFYISFSQEPAEAGTEHVGGITKFTTVAQA